MLRDDVYESMLRVEREHEVARHLLAGAAEDAQPGEIELPRHLRRRDLHHFEAGLSATYLLRLFAQYEAALRSLWADHYGRPSSPPMQVLIERVGTRMGVPADRTRDVHAVRITRNAIVHIGSAPIAFDWDEYHHRLRRYLAYAPVRW